MKLIKLVKQLVLSSFLIVSVGMAAVPALAHAESAVSSACTAIGSDTGCKTDSSGGVNITNVIATIINVLSIVVGIVAVIMIIIAGLNFITSGGDSNKVSTARNAILYAIIGLIIVGLAQGIVVFVLGRVG